MTRSKPRSRPLTPLGRQLAAAAPQKLEPVDAFRLARRKFVQGEAIDMQSLAEELGVSRVTLYRWVGNRERLLTEIIWNLGTRTLDKIVAELRARPQRRGSPPAPIVAEVLARFTADVISHHGMRCFVARDGAYALRLLSRADGEFQPRLIAAVKALLEADVRNTRWRPPIGLDELARTLVHLIEFHVHRQVITGEQPNPDYARVVLQLLLR